MSPVTTTISIDEVLNFLSDINHVKRGFVPVNGAFIDVAAVFEAFVRNRGSLSNDSIIAKASGIINGKNLLFDKEKEIYNKLFYAYIQHIGSYETMHDPGTGPISISASIKSSKESLSTIGEKASSYFDLLNEVKGDISQIGFYKIEESESLSGLPVVIPSSINIQEHLLNQPIPTIRSKSSAVMPDHRGKHIVSIDIVYPNFEAFATTAAEYPSFINLLNMFKFMPINSIYSPALCTAFVSQYTYPKFFDLVKQVYASEEFGDLSRGAKEKTRQLKVKNLAEELGIKNFADIKKLLDRDDPLLDIGLTAAADYAYGSIPELDDKNSSGIKELVSGGQGGGPAKFPVPVCFKSASIQTMADMPGAIVGRFAFGIVSSAAFPFGNITYRDDKGNPTFDPGDCYYGKKYVRLASEKMRSQVGIDKTNIIAGNPGGAVFDMQKELTLNDMRLYYFDISEGMFKFDTTSDRYNNGEHSSVILEKVSGSFNSKTIDIPLIGSKFPSCQYMGLNSNSIQMIFAVTDKQVISDFMAMKARIVDVERSKELNSSYGIIENTLINSLGISRVTPQSLTIESDSDNPELYRLVINFVENYEDLGNREKLQLEQGGISIEPIQMFWDYLYDLYRIWAYEEGILWGQSMPAGVNVSTQYFDFEPLKDLKQEGHRDKLIRLMQSIGVAPYRGSRGGDQTGSILNPVGSGEGNDVYFGPVLMGIIEEYAKATNRGYKATGFLESDFPELINHPFLNRKGGTIFIGPESDIAKHIEDIAFGKPLRAGTNIVDPWRGKLFIPNLTLLDILYKDINVEYTSITYQVENPSFWSRKRTPTLFDIVDREKMGFDKHGERSAESLIDLWHNHNRIIPKPIWDSILTAIMERDHTKGTDILVTRPVMDESFAVLHALSSQLQWAYTFDKETTGTTIPGALPVVVLKSVLEKKHGLPSKSIRAELNITKINQIQERIESSNNVPINLYPDLYLPTYDELFKGEGLSFDRKKELLIKFGPKYGDLGIIPDLDMKTMLTADISILSDMTSAELDEYIDPDIFYHRDRDKQDMCHLAKQFSKEADSSNSKTIALQINKKKLIRQFKEAKHIDKNISVSFKNKELKDYISGYINKGIAEAMSTDETDQVGADRLMGGFKQDSGKGLAFIRALKELIADEDPDLPNLLRIELITNESERISLGHIRRKKDGASDTNAYTWEYVGDAIGTKPIMHSPIGDLSIDLSTSKDINKVNEQQTLHMTDIADSVVRCFPTIRLYFIEEDRKNTYFKDDFYGFSDIIECSISSHIYDNDICTMKLANLSGVLSTESFSDYVVGRAIKSSSVSPNLPNTNKSADPESSASKIKYESVVDDEREKFMRKIMLRPGVHIMVKMGYGNNIKHLKTVFTGEIAEVKPGSVVEIIAQGYQSEIQGDYGGFMEQNWLENIGEILRYGNKSMLNPKFKFGFYAIVAFILSGNDVKTQRLMQNTMRHLGEPFTMNPSQKGVSWEKNKRYSYDNSIALETISAITGQNQGSMAAGREEARGDLFSWMNSWLEKSFFGYQGHNVTRNVYVATSNNTTINVANEWLVTNGPVIDGIREVTRYMPNFIATVVPYGHDATLFVGDPNGPYQYRKATKTEIEYNVKFSAANRDQDAYRTSNSAINIFVEAINELNQNIKIDIRNYNNRARESLGLKDYGHPATYPAELSRKAREQVGQTQILSPKDRNLRELVNNIYFAPLVLDSIGDVQHGKLFANFFRIPVPKGGSEKQILDDLAKLSKEMASYSVPSNLFTEETWSLYDATSIISIPQSNIVPGSRLRAAPPITLVFNDTSFLLSRNGTGIRLPLVVTNDYRSEIRFWGGSATHKAQYNFKVAGVITPDLIKEVLSDKLTMNADTHLIEHKLFSGGTARGTQNQVLLNILMYTHIGTGKYSETYASEIHQLQALIFAYKQVLLLAKMFLEKEHDSVIDDKADFVLNSIAGKDSVISPMPWNYKIFRDQHVVSGSNDIIANNLIATEADMWSAVALRVPQDTESLTQGSGDLGLFNYGVEEDGIDRGAGLFRIDPDQGWGIWPSKDSGGINYQGNYPGAKDILETFTEINATSPNLAQNVFKFRLAQGLSKMYRGNLIVMGRNIKPYDSIQIVDDVNKMYGKVMAERVIQNFSAINGWTTTIVPIGLTKVNSKLANLGISNWDRLLYTVSKGKTFKYAMNASILLSLGTVGLGARGTMVVLSKAKIGRGLFKGVIKDGFNLTKGIFGATTSSNSALWTLAKETASISRATFRAVAAQGAGKAAGTNILGGVTSTIGSRVMKGGLVSSRIWLAKAFSSGTADIVHQFMNMNISQSMALRDGAGSNATVHLPAQIYLMNYNGAPFIGGLEDAYASIRGNNAWDSLMEEFGYAWRDFWRAPSAVTDTLEDLNNDLRGE